MRNRRALLLLSLAIAAGIIAAVVLWRRGGGDDLLDATRKRIAALKLAVEEQRAASERAVANYVPRALATLDDFTLSAPALLQQLPGVVQVEALVTTGKPKHRIVHVRDYHLVPRDLFAAEARDLWGRDLTEAEVNALHEEHLLWVELVQLEQAAVLRCLARHHGVRQVLSEGMVDGEAAAYRRKAVELHEAGAALRRQLAAARGLLKRAEAGSDRHAKAVALEKDVLGLLAAHQLDALHLGVAARPLGAGEIGGALPLDDAALLDKAKPAPGGAVDAAANRAREDHQVKAALASGPVAVLVLGGGHDLSDSVRRVGGGAVEYLRVTTRGYVEADQAR